MRIHHVHRFATLLGAAVLSCVTLQAAAGPLNLSNTPLFLTTGVKPNLIMAIDDSGSMDFELLLPGNDGAAWWRVKTASGLCTAASGSNFVGCVADGSTDLPGTGALNFNNAGNANEVWKKYAYLFPNGNDSANTSFRRRSGDGGNDHFAIPPLPQYAWARASEFNAAYFNPAVTYARWTDGGGYTFANSSPSAAQYDPVYGRDPAADKMNLTNDVAGAGSVDPGLACASTNTGYAANWTFKVYSGMTFPAGTCYRLSGGTTATAWKLVGTGGLTVPASGVNNEATIHIRYFPATFYLKTTTALPTGYGWTGATLTGDSPSSSSALAGYEIKRANFDSDATYQAAIQNFANWFTFYRKRHLALRAGLGQSFSTVSGTRVSGFTINNRSAVTMLDIDTPASRTSLYTSMYSSWTGNGGTPNREAVSHIYDQYRGTGSTAPITHSCQRNFGMLFTDGFSNVGGVSGIGDVDSDADTAHTPAWRGVNPYKDGVSNTMADKTMQGYVTTLRTGTNFPAGRVKTPAACAADNPDPRLDCNSNLHMNFYGVTLGAKGLVFNSDAPIDPYVTAPTWPSATALSQARHPSAVDDLWHATINGRGKLFNAKSPREISEKLSELLSNISKDEGTASSGAVSSGSINSSSRVYQSTFNSATWSGDLAGYPINKDGTIKENSGPGSDVISALNPWSASDLVPTPDNRTILTVNTDGSVVPFRWTTGGLDAARKIELRGVSTGTAAELEELAMKRLAYLRGFRTNERTATDISKLFRERASVLGDIVNSAPAFVGAPAFRYRDNLESKPYSQYRVDQQERDEMIYVGANDGMLHAFDAETGTERWAFIPAEVFPNLYTLTDPNYQHRFFVDGSPTTGDAFIGNDWRTVLVSGLNGGGQSMFALDVTETDYSETSTEPPFLWQYSDENDVDLGYTYSRPSIVRMHNGKWAAVFGNGYNNTVADGHASTTGNAVLYIIDLETGTRLAKLDTGAGTEDDPTTTVVANKRPNGLSTPALVDLDSDNIVDFAYAGDLFGNLWKFDLSSANAADWKVAYQAGSNPAPLFKAVNDSAKAQPITSKPSVSRGPKGNGLMILFGTGKYLEPSDLIIGASTSRTDVQSFYGIIDTLLGTSADLVSGRTVLTKQTIDAEVSSTFGERTAEVRVTSKNVTIQKGWYLDLLSPVKGFEGERQVSDALIRDGQVIFTTLIPNQDECGDGGTSWLMALDLFNGGQLDITPFNMNGDKLFNQNDYVTVEITLPNGTKKRITVPVSGIKTKVGITPRPASISSGPDSSTGNCDYLIMPGTTGDVQTECRNPGPRGVGRQSWRQLH